MIGRTRKSPAEKTIAAELARLDQVVAAANQARSVGDAPVFVWPEEAAQGEPALAVGA